MIATRVTVISPSVRSRTAPVSVPAWKIKPAPEVQKPGKFDHMGPYVPLWRVHTGSGAEQFHQIGVECFDPAIQLLMWKQRHGSSFLKEIGIQGVKPHLTPRVLESRAAYRQAFD